MESCHAWAVYHLVLTVSMTLNRHPSRQGRMRGKAGLWEWASRRFSWLKILVGPLKIEYGVPKYWSYAGLSCDQSLTGLETIAVQCSIANGRVLEEHRERNVCLHLRNPAASAHVLHLTDLDRIRICVLHANLCVYDAWWIDWDQKLLLCLRLLSVLSERSCLPFADSPWIIRCQILRLRDRPARRSSDQTWRRCLEPTRVISLASLGTWKLYHARIK